MNDEVYEKAVAELGRHDERVAAVGADTLDLIGLRGSIAHAPARVIDVGIAEQNAMGAAAGLATTGLRPFVCVCAPFITARSVEQTVEHVKGWLLLWVALPNAVADRTPLKRDMLIVIGEMPRIGFLRPVMDGYTMAAGKGVHFFWCFAQSISAPDSSWGKKHRKTLLHLAVLGQVLGFPRTDAEGAEELSKVIGTATFEGRTEDKSGTIAESRIVSADTHWQAGKVAHAGARALGDARRADDAGPVGEAGQLQGGFRAVGAEDRRKQRRSKAAAAPSLPATLLFGVLVEQQFQVIPLHDPSGGWSGWIWETHGRAIVDCAAEAMRTDAEVDCALAVRRP